MLMFMLSGLKLCSQSVSFAFGLPLELPRPEECKRKYSDPNRLLEVFIPITLGADLSLNESIAQFVTVWFVKVPVFHVTPQCHPPTP